MPRDFSLSGIDRAHQLLSNSVAMTALLELDLTGQPQWVAQHVDRQTASDALALLTGLGLITQERHNAPDPDEPVSITPKGAGFVRMLDDMSHERANE